MRAEFLGEVVELASGDAEARWTDSEGEQYSEKLPGRATAIAHVARHRAGGLRFHDLRHSYATWLVDDGVPPNRVQRVLGHEKSATTLDLYTRRTDNSDRILQALTDPVEPDDGGGALAPA